MKLKKQHTSSTFYFFSSSHMHMHTIKGCLAENQYGDVVSDVIRTIIIIQQTCSTWYRDSAPLLIWSKIRPRYQIDDVSTAAPFLEVQALQRSAYHSSCSGVDRFQPSTTTTTLDYCELRVCSSFRFTTTRLLLLQCYLPTQTLWIVSKHHDDDDDDDDDDECKNKSGACGLVPDNIIMLGMDDSPHCPELYKWKQHSYEYYQYQNGTNEATVVII